MNWKNIYISKNNIETETARAVLIKMPNKSDYASYIFWHPAKLVRESRGGKVSIGYTDDFKFKIFKNGNGKYNRFDKIDEKEISAEEIEEAFGAMNDHYETLESHRTYDGGYTRIIRGL